MQRVVSLALAAVLVTGCIAVPALKERREIRREALWMEEHCPGTRGPDGAVIQQGAINVSLERVVGDWFQCNGAQVRREAVQAMGDSKIPRDPMAVEWIGAYALDTVLDLDASKVTKKTLLEAMEGHILAQGELMGTFERTKD